MNEISLSEKIENLKQKPIFGKSNDVIKATETMRKLIKKEIAEAVLMLKEHKDKIPIDKNVSYIQGRMDAIGIFNSNINEILGEFK